MTIPNYITHIQMKQHRQSNNERQKQRHHTTMPRIQLLNQSNKQHNRTHKQFTHSNKWSRFYQSRAWNDLRMTQLMTQPLCERCLQHDKVTPATQCHHRCVFGDAPTEELQWYWFLKPDNIVSLCNNCHTHIHMTNERGWIYHWPFDGVE
jgi:5-methylcytosine-specific restriction protein A